METGSAGRIRAHMRALSASTGGRRPHKVGSKRKDRVDSRADAENRQVQPAPRYACRAVRTPVARYVACPAPPVRVLAATARLNGNGTLPSELDLPFHNPGLPKFHLVPRNGWHRFAAPMGCGARNTMTWRGKPAGLVPRAPGPCWLLPVNGTMARTISRMQGQLRKAGWKVLTCDVGLIEILDNKVNLRTHAERLGLLEHLPRHYASPEDAQYPCILKAAIGEHGRGVYLVRSAAEARKHVGDGALGARWLMQELIEGAVEYAVSLLVRDGRIVDAVSTAYEYDATAYAWPHDVEEVGRSTSDDVPAAHMAVMEAMIGGYSGICNFNYKVRADGALCIFEVNARIGADLACDVPRARARAFFEKLDEPCARRD